MNKKILEALSGKVFDAPPIWLMRQAGRYLPEYKQIRKNAGSFLDMCYNPELAAEVTLQPIRRFGFDAAIIFSDILVVPHALGVGLSFEEGTGPVLEKIDSREKIENLKRENIESKLKPVFEAIKIVRKSLPEETALIGFAGAPWTVATYMIEGRGSKDFSGVKKFAFSNSEDFNTLISLLTDVTIDYLIMQIEAGAEIIKIFDSWAGVLAENEFDNWVIKPIKKIIEQLKKKYPQVPVIAFPKGAGISYEKFIRETNPDAIAVDYTVPVKWIKDNLQKKKTVQGNLDPSILVGDKKRLVEEIKKIKEELCGGPFIFNLGHGILPYTPIENVEILIKTVRGE